MNQLHLYTSTPVNWLDQKHSSLELVWEIILSGMWVLLLGVCIYMWVLLLCICICIWVLLLCICICMWVLASSRSRVSSCTWAEFPDTNKRVDKLHEKLSVQSFASIPVSENHVHDQLDTRLPEWRLHSLMVTQFTEGLSCLLYSKMFDTTCMQVPRTCMALCTSLCRPGWSSPQASGLKRPSVAWNRPKSSSTALWRREYKVTMNLISLKFRIVTINDLTPSLCY